METRDAAATGRPEKNPVRMLIPKKVAKLATRRNQLRRLIKEVLRLEHSLAKEKIYIFKVFKDPGDIGLEGVKKAIHELRFPR